MNKRGILIVLSGFSGAGKGTIVKRLLEDYDRYVVSVSATTRAPRPGEIEGKDYFFRTKQEFEQMIAENAFIEYAQYVDNYYGTPRAWVEEQLASGKDVILEIEIQGGLHVKEQYPDTLMLFVTTKDSQTLRERLIGRGTESDEVIEGRMKRASEEIEEIDAYDYLVVNDDLDTCVAEVHALIQGEHSRLNRNTEFIDNMKKDLKGLVKGE